MTKTTVDLREDVAKALRIYIATSGRSWREQSIVINELLMKGIECSEKEATA